MIISALINNETLVARKKRNAFQYFMLFIRIAFRNKINTVVERVHLIYWVLKEKITSRKIASLQNANLGGLRWPQ